MEARSQRLERMHAQWRFTPQAVFVIIAVMIAPPALGSHGGTMDCPDYTQYIPPDSTDTTYPVYVAVDEWIGSHWPWSIWIYAESNGERGLQRDDWYCYDVDADGRPYTPETADTLIW